MTAWGERERACAVLPWVEGAADVATGHIANSRGRKTPDKPALRIARDLLWAQTRVEAIVVSFFHGSNVDQRMSIGVMPKITLLNDVRKENLEDGRPQPSP
jgi:hypothetical protein